MNYQSNLQSSSYPFFFIRPCSSPLILPQSGVLPNFSQSIQLINYLKVSGRPLSSSALLLFLMSSTYQIASLMFLAVRFIQGSSPFSRKMSEQRKLSSSSFLPIVFFELAARLLNLNEPLNRSLRSSVMCLPFLMQRELSQKSDRQILCFILPLPTRKLLGLISPCRISLLWRYSILSSICRPTMSTVFNPSLPPHLILRVSTLSPSSSITRQARWFSQKASLISGKPWRCGCFNFWQVCISFWKSVFSFWEQLLRMQVVPSSFLQRCSCLYSRFLMVYTTVYLSFIMKQSITIHKSDKSSNLQNC